MDIDITMVCSVCVYSNDGAFSRDFFGSLNRFKLSQVLSGRRNAILWQYFCYG